MGTASAIDSIAEGLFGKARRAVLALLFRDPSRSYYVREIVRIAGVGQGAVQRELEGLTRAGLLERQRRGNMVFYQANSASPVFAELRGLIVKTSGVADVLRAALAELADRIDVAFVYGSVARGTETAGSDLDVLVVGEVGFGEVVAAFDAAEQELGREINPVVFPREEAAEKARGGDHFLGTVLSGPKVFLLGGEDELSSLAR